MQAEHLERGRVEKGKGKETKEDRDKEKGKGKKRSHSPSQSSSSMDLQKHLSWAKHRLIAPIEPTSGPHQTSRVIDNLIGKRLEFLRNSDARQRRDLGLPDQADHDLLSRLRAREKMEHERLPLLPTTQEEFERKRDEAFELRDFAKKLPQTSKLEKEVSNLLRRVTEAESKAELRSPKKLSDSAWLKGASSMRTAQGLPRIDELSKMEKILYGSYKKTKPPKTRQEAEERHRLAGKTLDLALKRLKSSKPPMSKEDRARLEEICKKIFLRRDEHLETRRSLHSDRAAARKAFPQNDLAKPALQ